VLQLPQILWVQGLRCESSEIHACAPSLFDRLDGTFR